MLIQCPECKQQISDQAESCPKCGKALTDAERIAAVKAAESQKKTTQAATVGCVVIFCAAMIFLSFTCNRSLAPRGSASQAGRDSSYKKIEAWTMAEQFVKKQLRAPSTASFGSVFGDYQDPDERVTSLAQGRYKVVGWVDAENAFGAKVRSDFVCVLRDMGNDNWRCEQIDVISR